MKRYEKIVAIGGGTGLSTLLYTLKKYTPNITAIVTVGDDGGGSGRLRQDLGILPPGDIRACLLALSNTKESMEKLFSYRFTKGDLKGQSFGNLFIAAMGDIYSDFGIGIKEASKVLNITGRVLPVTLEKMDLIAELENGKKYIGESAIPLFSKKENSKIKKMYLEKENTNILDEALDAINNADLIILGPGSLYTSVIPNLLVKNTCEGIFNSKAKTVYVCNLMTQSGETDNYTVYDHIKAIIEHSSEGIIDYCFANTTLLDESFIDKYSLEESFQVIPSDDDFEKLENLGIELIIGDFITTKDGFVRTNSENIYLELLKIFEQIQNKHA